MGTAPTEGRWRRLDALFQAALERRPEERGAYLDAETAGDAELRREVEEMLAHAGDAEARIAGSIASMAQSVALSGAWEGRRIGSYRLVREIGRGGMGIVFEAVRDDAEYRKTVALKILPAWRDLPGLRERFRNERQILAGLDHPNIARFLEGGSEQGVPYIVMEYIDGVTLSEWRRLRNPDLRDSIGLFRQVCGAVHFAHENLVVHRDLKPANILVGRDGVPKLLDFGIAKLLAPSPGDGATITELRHWTPDYASPEQVRGGSITTRTDVYLLGLILYELLCGERAQTADTTSPVALDRSVCEVEPRPPSVRAAERGEAAPARQLRGDLDTIVAKAIAKDPRRRYDSAAALSADLEAYLAGRPVSARPATVLYRVGKLVRRRRLAFAAGALVAATGAAGIIATVHQERRVERRFEQVRALATALVFDVHDRIRYLPGATEARKAIVATGLRYLESLREDAASDASLALELAQAYLRIGDVQGHPLFSSLHDTAGAWKSYGAARGLLEPLYKKGDERADLPMAQVEYREGLLEYGRADWKGSEASFGRSEAILRRVLGRSPRNTEALKLAGDISSQRARSATDAHDPGAARRAAESAVEIARRLTALQPGSADSLDYLSEAQSSLGAAYRSAGLLEESARSFQEAVATREQLVRRAPQNTGYRRMLMIGYGHMGDSLGPPSVGLDDLERASQAYAKAVEIARGMLRQDPADRTARSDLANAEYRAGDALRHQPARMNEALAFLQESERGFSDLLKEDPSNERWRYMLLFARRKTAEALEALGRSAEAAPKLVANEALAQSFKGSSNARGAEVEYVVDTTDLARVKAGEGAVTAALALAGRAAEEIPKVLPSPTASPWGEATLYSELGGVYLQVGEKDKAALWLRKSLGVWRSMKVPGELERKRSAEAAAVEARLARVVR